MGTQPAPRLMDRLADSCKAPAGDRGLSDLGAFVSSLNSSSAGAGNPGRLKPKVWTSREPGRRETLGNTEPSVNSRVEKAETQGLGRRGRNSRRDCLRKKTAGSSWRWRFLAGLGGVQLGPEGRKGCGEIPEVL